MVAKQFLNTVDAAKYLQISPSTLYKLTSKRQIKFYKPSGLNNLFCVDDLNAYITSGERTTMDAIESEAARRVFLKR